MAITNNLSIREIKKIMDEIIEEEISNTKVDVSNNQVTLMDFLLSEKFNRFSFLQKMVIYSNVRGFADWRNKEITVFVDKQEIARRLRSKFYLVDLIRTTYHEFRHCLQMEKMNKADFSDVEYFIFTMEDYVLNSDYEDYKENHDEYLIESDADIYAINKVRDFMKKNPGLYEKNRFYIDSLQKRHEINMKNFDFQHLFSIFNKIMQYKGYEFKEPWIRVFYDKNWNFRKLDELLNNEDFHNINLEFRYMFISSREFIESIDYNTLSEKGREFLNEAINYSYNKALKRRNNNIKILQNGMWDVKSWLESDCTLVDTITYFNNILMYYKMFKIHNKKYYEGLIGNIDEKSKTSR